MNKNRKIANASVQRVILIRDTKMQPLTVYCPGIGEFLHTKKIQKPVKQAYINPCSLTSVAAATEYSWSKNKTNRTDIIHCFTLHAFCCVLLSPSEGINPIRANGSDSYQLHVLWYREGRPVLPSTKDRVSEDNASQFTHSSGADEHRGWCYRPCRPTSIVDIKKKLDVTFRILYFSSNSCSTCLGQPCAHHQELTTA